MASELLSDVEVRNAKPADKPRKLGDGNGLTLLVHSNGSKYFQLRYTLHGKEKTLQLGSYPDMSLSDARAKAAEARKLVSSGTDPVQERKRREVERANEAETTFRSVADERIQLKSSSISISYQTKIVATFTANVYPRIGKQPINTITSPDLLATLKVMEARGSLELMGKCRAWLGQVFDYAKATGKLKGDNPVSCLVGVLKTADREGYPTFVNRNDAGEFMRRLTDYHGRPETRLAIWCYCSLPRGPANYAPQLGKSSTWTKQSGLFQKSA